MPINALFLCLSGFCLLFNTGLFASGAGLESFQDFFGEEQESAAKDGTGFILEDRLIREMVEDVFAVVLDANTGRQERKKALHELALLDQVKIQIMVLDEAKKLFNEELQQKYPSGKKLAQILWAFSKATSWAFAQKNSRLHIDIIERPHTKFFSSLIEDPKLPEELKVYAVRMWAEILVYAGHEVVDIDIDDVMALARTHTDKKNLYLALVSLSTLALKPQEIDGFMADYLRRGGDLSNSHFLKFQKPYFDAIKWVHAALSDTSAPLDRPRLRRQFVFNQINQYLREKKIYERSGANCLAIYWETEHGSFADDFGLPLPYREFERIKDFHWPKGNWAATITRIFNRGHAP